MGTDVDIDTQKDNEGPVSTRGRQLAQIIITRQGRSKPNVMYTNRRPSKYNRKYTDADRIGTENTGRAQT